MTIITYYFIVAKISMSI